MSNVTIIPIENTRREIKKFVRFAWEIYWGNTYCVPPLITEQVKFIHKSSYHETGVIQPYFALRNGKNCRQNNCPL
jgi:hypothetical protein